MEKGADQVNLKRAPLRGKLQNVLVQVQVQVSQRLNTRIHIHIQVDHHRHGILWN
jgi:hypothetical protein